MIEPKMVSRVDFHIKENDDTCGALRPGYDGADVLELAGQLRTKFSPDGNMGIYWHGCDAAVRLLGSEIYESGSRGRTRRLPHPLKGNPKSSAHVCRKSVGMIGHGWSRR